MCFYQMSMASPPRLDLWTMWQSLGGYSQISEELWKGILFGCDACMMRNLERVKHLVLSTIRLPCLVRSWQISGRKALSPSKPPLHHNNPKFGHQQHPCTPNPKSSRWRNPCSRCRAADPVATTTNGSGPCSEHMHAWKWPARLHMSSRHVSMAYGAAETPPYPCLGDDNFLLPDGPVRRPRWTYCLLDMARFLDRRSRISRTPFV
jgi:hypothetical protein